MSYTWPGSFHIFTPVLIWDTLKTAFSRVSERNQVNLSFPQIIKLIYKTSVVPSLNGAGLAVSGTKLLFNHVDSSMFTVKCFSSPSVLIFGLTNCSCILLYLMTILLSHSPNHWYMEALKKNSKQNPPVCFLYLIISNQKVLGSKSLVETMA